MHTHSVNLTLETAPDDEDIRELLAAESRLFVIPERLAIDGAGKLKEYASDAGRPRGDIWENCIWAESVTMEGRDCYLFQAIHQEADVVPENIDAIRAITDRADKQQSMQVTDESLGVGTGLINYSPTETDQPLDTVSD